MILLFILIIAWSSVPGTWQPPPQDDKILASLFRSDGMGVLLFGTHERAAGTDRTARVAKTTSSLTEAKRSAHQVALFPGNSGLAGDERRLSVLLECALTDLKVGLSLLPARHQKRNSPRIFPIFAYRMVDWLSGLEGRSFGV